MSAELRWKQRFQNFENVFAVFERRLTEYHQYPKQEAYQMALIQAFEIIIELAWKTLKYYLAHLGYQELNNPKNVIRQAYQAKLFQNAEIWMEALEKRNLASHTYNLAILEELVHFIDKPFSSSLLALFNQLKQEL
jgi:nucleotidyltransferase substrate binding protein (TIGR01987 family)